MATKALSVLLEGLIYRDTCKIVLFTETGLRVIGCVLDICERGTLRRKERNLEAPENLLSIALYYFCLLSTVLVT